jgi:NADH-quinone oxidoreductase subunit J
MSFTSIVFYVLSVILIFASFRVVTAKNPVHAALYLVLAFLPPPGTGFCLKPSFSPLPWCWCMSAR